MKSESQQTLQREYRLISGGEDGMILWWNINYQPQVASMSKEHNLFSQSKKMIVYVE